MCVLACDKLSGRLNQCVARVRVLALKVLRVQQVLQAHQPTATYTNTQVLIRAALRLGRYVYNWGCCRRSDCRGPQPLPLAYSSCMPQRCGVSGCAHLQTAEHPRHRLQRGPSRHHRSSSETGTKHSSSEHQISTKRLMISDCGRRCRA